MSTQDYCISNSEKIISSYSDDELKNVAEQVLRLYETGATDEQPLRSLIDNYPMGSSKGVAFVPVMVMQECMVRWLKLQ